MVKTVDARGLACPQPVLLTRRMMAEDPTDEIVTIVDNDAARQNVARMAAKEGYRVQIEERQDGLYLHLFPGQGMGEAEPGTQCACGSAAPTAGPLVLVVGSDQMGRGPEELGSILIRALLHTLGEVQPQPDTIILFNAGVKLAVAGSPVLEDLRALAEGGSEILACGTCLAYFGLKEQLAVGQVSNMYSIAETILRAGKVVTL